MPRLKKPYVVEESPRLCSSSPSPPPFFFSVTSLKPSSGQVSSSLIRLKHFYNFLCSMLVFTPFALCFITRRGIFMHFLELTYWQDATVPVPCFLLFLCFRKATQEIFSELDETKAETLIFPGWRTKTEREPEGGPEGSHTIGWHGPPPSRAP
jgi:hypothetical protein